MERWKNGTGQRGDRTTKVSADAHMQVCTTYIRSSRSVSRPALHKEPSVRLVSNETRSPLFIVSAATDHQKRLVRLAPKYSTTAVVSSPLQSATKTA